MFLPNEGAGFWPLISMGAILGGTMRSPFTSIVFAFELTHDANVFLPLLVGSVIAHAFTVLTLQAFHPHRESRAARISSQPRIRGRSAGNSLCARSDAHENRRRCRRPASLTEILHSLHTNHRQSQRLLPVVDTEGRLAGVITRGDIRERMEHEGDAVLRSELQEIVRPRTVETYPDETLRWWYIAWRKRE